MENENTAYFKLGEKKGGTIFWDPSQTKNKKLLQGQVKELELTEKVNNMKLNQGIVEVSKKEFDAYEASLAKEEKATKAQASKAGDDLSQMAVEKFKEAENKMKAADEREKKLDEREKGLNEKSIKLTQAEEEAQAKAKESGSSTTAGDSKSGDSKDKK